MLTDPGVLNRRATILSWTSVQDGVTLKEVYEPIATVWSKLEPVGALTYWFGQQQLETGVTHRITIRRTSAIRPETLTGRVCIEIEGVRYQILRTSDLEGAKRFTVIDVCRVEEVE